MDRPDLASGPPDARTRPSDSAWDVRVERLTSGSTVVRVIGVIDATAAPHVVWRLRLVLRRGPFHPAHISLDLSGVVFLDRVGLDALLGFQSTVEMLSGTLELLDPTPAALRLLHEANLDGESGSVPPPRRPG